MLVFPANDDKYRQRKRVLKACLQCKRSRKRCVASDTGTCIPCQKANIPCTYATDDIVRPFDFKKFEQPSNSRPASNRPSVSRSAGSLSVSGSCVVSGSSVPGSASTSSCSVNSTSDSSPPPSLAPAPFKPLRLTADVMSAKRPGIHRTTSHNSASSRSAAVGSASGTTSTSAATRTKKHKRSGSHQSHVFPYERFLNLGIQDNPFYGSTGLSSPLSNTTTPDGSFSDAGYFGRVHSAHSAHHSHHHTPTGFDMLPSSPMSSVDNLLNTAGNPMNGNSVNRNGMNTSPLNNLSALDSMNAMNRNTLNSMNMTNPSNNRNSNNNNSNRYSNNGSYPQSSPAALAPSSRATKESIGVWVRGVTSQQQLNPHLHAYLASIDAFLMPLRPNRDALIDIYFSSIQTILPLVDREPFLKLHSVGQAPTLLLHAVLLAAARHPRAHAYLGDETVRQFCASTAAKIRALMFAQVEQDRVTLARTYALLSLHAEGPDGLDLGCSDLESAIHCAISANIHQEKMAPSSNGNPGSTSSAENRASTRLLWWSLWCMDRISACVNARPLIINSDDIAIPRLLSHEHARLAQLTDQCMNLEKVIFLYRPGMDLDAIRSSQPAVIDDLFIGDDTIDPANAIMALLHYTAVTLVHKRLNTADSVVGTPMSSSASSLRKKRQKIWDLSPIDAKLLSAAGSILRIITNCRDLIPLPLVPYCASLTLTVFLRTYPRFDTETGASWHNSCMLLEAMADRWWVAGVMGTMGRNLFNSLQEEEESRLLEQQYLNMFSDLPNQTSFLDQAMSLDGFDDLEQWLQEKP